MKNFTRHIIIPVWLPVDSNKSLTVKRIEEMVEGNEYGIKFTPLHFDRCYTVLTSVWTTYNVKEMDSLAQILLMINTFRPKPNL